jgi:hypothetical protein
MNARTAPTSLDSSLLHRCRRPRSTAGPRNRSRAQHCHRQQTNTESQREKYPPKRPRQNSQTALIHRPRSTNTNARQTVAKQMDPPSEDAGPQPTPRLPKRLTTNQSREQNQQLGRLASTSDKPPGQPRPKVAPPPKTHRNAKHQPTPKDPQGFAQRSPPRPLPATHRPDQEREGVDDVVTPGDNPWSSCGAERSQPAATGRNKTRAESA